MTQDVFVSYSSLDKSEVDLLCNSLEESGITYWRDKKDLHFPDIFSAKIAEAIEMSRIIVFVSSKNSNNSPWVVKEIFYGLENGKKVVPFNLDKEPYNSSLKLMLAMYHRFDAFPPPVKQHLQSFITGIGEILKANENEKPYLKRITDKNDVDLKTLLEIYRECFPSEKNVAEEFIVMNLSIFTYEHQAYLFVLKTSNRILGIADVSYFSKYKRLFVSYIGVYKYKSPGDKLIYTVDIVEGLIQYFKEKSLIIEDIIFETQEERVYRYFSRVLKTSFSLKTYKLSFDYHQPEMVSDDISGITKELQANLIYVPMDSRHHLKYMSKKQVLKLIKFVYFNIYDSITDLPTNRHKAYLEGLLCKYENELPLYVPLEE